MITINATDTAKLIRGTLKSAFSTLEPAQGEVPAELLPERIA
jgi:hypothetical protein